MVKTYKVTSLQNGFASVDVIETTKLDLKSGLEVCGDYRLRKGILNPGIIKSIQEDTEEEPIEKDVSDVLYLEPSINEHSVTSMNCYYKNKNYKYDNVTTDNIEIVLDTNDYLEINKENTKIYINTEGIGMWVYDFLLSKGYKVDYLNYYNQEIIK